ncbi:MAG: SDR family NAD(P)-dependent oxidoreductase, partial [Burkholderiaceae bacterium]
MDLQLRGAHALVTGAGRGIGRAIAQRLADEGCQVTLLGRDSPVLAATAAQIGPARAYAVVADVTDRAAVEAALAQARAHFGPLRIVVNNAGAAESAPFAQLDAVQWQRMLDLNLTGAFHVTQAALSDLLAGHGARVVNVASTAALKGYGYVAAYVAAKHGLLGLTRALAAEYAQRVAVGESRLQRPWREPPSGRNAVRDYVRLADLTEADLACFDVRDDLELTPEHYAGRGIGRYLAVDEH